MANKKNIKEYEIKHFKPLMRLAPGKLGTIKLPRYVIEEECNILSEIGIYPIPKGFVTDGASVPLLARLVIPSMSMHFGAVVVHDFYCKLANEHGMYAYREKADSEFYANLIECGTNKIRAKIMSFAVIQYGKMLKKKGVLR